MSSVRKTLDSLYLAGGIIASLFLIAILTIILLQMLARWTGQVFPGATDYAGYSMACASFFAFAYTLNHNAHIRVSILLSALGRFRRWGELWCFGIGSIIATYLAWYAVRGNWWSWKLNEISQGLDKTPIWIPQLAMSIGSILLAIAFWDNFVSIVLRRGHNMSGETVDQEHGE